MSELHNLDTGSSSTMLTHARQWARGGWRVFPLHPGGKTPLTAHGFKDASRDEAVITGWWTQYPEANIALATGDGVVVLDIDRKNGKDGFASLAEAGVDLATINTYTVHSPSGGAHLYFHPAAPVKSRVDVLGKGSGVDIRGEGGYIVVPPSQVNGIAYAPADPGCLLPEITQLADWEVIATHLPAEPAHQQESSFAWDEMRFGQAATPDVIERARSYLRKCPPAISGQGGHNSTFKVASILVNGFCLDEGTAMVLLQEWNQRCQPPWTDAEIRHKLHDAAFRGPPSGKPLGWLRYGSSEQQGLVKPISADESEDDDTETCEGEWCGDEEAAKEFPYPPHFMGATACWIEMRGEKPYRPFAILAALAVWSTVLGRKVRFENQSPIVYGGMLAVSSNGKDAPLALARDVLMEIGVSTNHLAGRLSSWNAGVEALQRAWFHPVELALVDEAAGYFGGGLMKSDYGLADFIKAAWSRGLGTLEPQARTRKSGSTRLRAIHHPSYSMLLAAQPSALGDAIRTEQLEDGLLPRTLWVVRQHFEPMIREENLRASRRLDDSLGGQWILAQARAAWNWLVGKDKDEFSTIADLEGLQPDEDLAVPREIWAQPIEFTAEPEAAAVFSAFIAKTQALIQPAAEGKEGPYGFLWGKAAENAKRVALIIAAARCAATSGPYTIQADEAKWAVQFVESTVNGGIEWAKTHLADTPFQRMVNRVSGLIKTAGPEGLARRTLNRRLRHTYRPLQVEEALQSLLDAGSITAESVYTGGAPKTVYKATGRRRGKSS